MGKSEDESKIGDKEIREREDNIPSGNNGDSSNNNVPSNNRDHQENSNKVHNSSGS